nr:TMV resistance protein N-like isoform X2 [Ipomoea batatas]
MPWISSFGLVVKALAVSSEGTERVEGIKLEMQMLEANESAKETINMNYGKKGKLAEFLGKSEGHLSKKSQYGFFWHSRDCAEASNLLIFTIGKQNICPKISHIDLPRSLVHLSLAKCNLSDDKFPIAFSNLSMLESLDLSNNLVCSLPESIRCLRGLQDLNFSSCPRLKSLIGLPHISKMLGVEDCMSLEKISYQAELAEGLRMILYQPGIFTTFLPGDCIPSWFNSEFTFTSPQSSFTLPTIDNYRIQGLSFCLVYLCSDDKEAALTYTDPSIHINDKTNLLGWWLQPPYFGIPNGREGMMWLSHWNFGNWLQSGDVLIIIARIFKPLRFKELGIKIWYVEGQQVNTEESSFETVSKHANPCGDVVPMENPGQPRFSLWLESMRLKKPKQDKSFPHC